MQQLIQYVEQLVPRGMDFILSLAIGIIVFFVGSKLIKKLLKIVRRSMEKREMDPGVISFFLSASKITLYVFLVIIVAQIFGFAASSIIAIVGSAGLAIGLALQGSLANFAGGVLILIMKPFCVGDYIIVGDVEGVVQKIDVVYTTLTTADTVPSFYQMENWQILTLSMRQKKTAAAWIFQLELLMTHRLIWQKKC